MARSTLAATRQEATDALYALRDTKQTPEAKLLTALGAVEELTPYVHGPFKVVSA